MKVQAPENIGLVQRTRKRLLFLVIMLTLGVLLFISSSIHDEGIHDLIESVGIGLIAAGILGRMWSTLYIGGRKVSNLVHKGPYSVTRNPLYVFSSIAAAGVGAQTGSVTVAALFFIGCAIAFYILIFYEEAFLAEHHGAAYQAYLKRVPRFFPNLAIYEDLPELTIVPRRLYVTMLDGMVFFLAMPFFEFVEYLQETGYLPVLLNLP